jgi:integrase
MLGIVAASLALDADQPMELIARFLRHRDANTTARIYARPSTSKLKGVSDAVDLSTERAKRR